MSMYASPPIESAQSTVTTAASDARGPGADFAKIAAAVSEAGTKEQGGDLGWLFARRNAEDRALSIRVTSDEAHRAVEIAQSFFEAAKVILEG